MGAFHIIYLLWGLTKQVLKPQLLTKSMIPSRLKGKAFSFWNSSVFYLPVLQT